MARRDLLAEEMIYGGTWAHMRRQFEHAYAEMMAIELDLIARGYVNTIHDCWEIPPEDYPGQAFYHEHNPRIRNAELNWRVKHESVWLA